MDVPLIVLVKLREEPAAEGLFLEAAFDVVWPLLAPGAAPA